RRECAVYLELRAFSSAAAERSSSGARIARDREILERLVRSLRSGWPLDRGGPTLAHRAEGADLSADPLPCCGTDGFASRTGRRRTQLGLSLLLAEGRHLHAARVWHCWLLRGSEKLAGLAAPCGCRPPGSVANYVRPQR